MPYAPVLNVVQLDRFWAKVHKTDGCWIWTSARSGNHPDPARRYGQITIAGAIHKAARLSYVLAFGPIPDGQQALHRCDNPPCVRPDHLFLGTNLDNIADRHAKGRDARGDRNGARTQPQTRPRGPRHGSKTKPDRVARGAAFPWTKLSPNNVRKIRVMLDAGGMTYAAIAQRFGITTGSLYKIRIGKSWGHVV